MRAIRDPECHKKSGLCERQRREMEQRGEFPRRFLLSPNGRAVAWLESEVDEWVAARAATRVAA